MMNLINLLELTVDADNIGTDAGFCSGTAEIWQLVGNILLIVKIVIPIIVIILGMIDIGKSVVADKPEEITKSF